MKNEKNAPDTNEAVKSESTVKVPGMRVEVTGIAVHAIKGEVEYTTVLTLPRREHWRMFLEEGVTLALRKEDANYMGVISHYIDNEDEVDVDVTFIGKDPRNLNRDEIFAAKCYYGLRGIKCAEDLRAARMMVYKQLCELLSMEVPKDDLIKKWPTLTLCKLYAPSGDSMCPKNTPIKFIPDGGSIWIKKFIKD